MDRRKTRTHAHTKGLTMLPSRGWRLVVIATFIIGTTFLALILSNHADANRVLVDMANIRSRVLHRLGPTSSESILRGDIGPITSVPGPNADCFAEISIFTASVHVQHEGLADAITPTNLNQMELLFQQTYNNLNRDVCDPAVRTVEDVSIDRQSLLVKAAPTREVYVLRYDIRGVCGDCRDNNAPSANVLLFSPKSLLPDQPIEDNPDNDAPNDKIPDFGRGYGNSKTTEDRPRSE